MKAKDLEALSAEDRNKKREEIQLELMKERAQIAAGTSPKNPGAIRRMRRTIARINTLESGGKK